MERIDFEQWKAREVARLLTLVETERRYYQEMIGALPVAVAVLGADQSLVYANRAFRQKFTLRGEDVRRKSIGQILAVEDWAERIRTAPCSFSANGLRVSLVPRRWDDYELEETMVVVEEASAGLSIQQPVEEKPQEPEPAAASYPGVLWEADPETLAFRALDGDVERLWGKPAADWLADADSFEARIHPEDRAAVLALYRQAISNRADATAEFRAAQGNAWIRETIRATEGAVWGISAAGAARKDLELQQAIAERHEALQQIAARLAHDLNNPLMIAAGYGEELVDAVPQGPARQDLSELLAALSRISAIAAQLTDFGRKRAKAPVRVDVGALLTQAQPDIAAVAGAAVELIPNGEPLWASADPAQLTEAILACASRGREDTAQRTKLSITWSAASIEEQAGEGAPAPGKYARIELADDGAGLAPRKRVSLFESILPDKDPASPGPHLTQAYALIRAWGGVLAVNDAAPGTVFSIYLPYLEPEAVPVAEPEPPPAVVEPEPVAEVVPEPELFRETILVVDDEAGIRGLVRKILRRERYQVLEAGSAEEALSIAMSHSSTIHLLLTDVMLPGLSGPGLARRMYEAAPSLRVLYISGYTEDESVRAGEYPPGARFLPKPFTLSALVNSVRETLDVE